MPIRYKRDIVAALKEKGYNTNKLRQEKLLAEGVIQSLRQGEPISWANISKLCSLLDCQPGDLMEYVREGATDGVD
jgi:putative transcriptional regulator